VPRACHAGSRTRGADAEPVLAVATGLGLIPAAIADELLRLIQAHALDLKAVRKRLRVLARGEHAWSACSVPAPSPYKRRRSLLCGRARLLARVHDASR